LPTSVVTPHAAREAESRAPEAGIALSDGKLALDDLTQGVTWPDQDVTWTKTGKVVIVAFVFIATTTSVASGRFSRAVSRAGDVTAL
jgi:hypothetical protein